MIRINKKLGSPSVRFTPEFYRRAYKNFKDGNLRDLIALMKEAAVDSHVTGCLLGRRAGFQKEWVIRPYEDTSADVERAEFIQRMLEKVNTRLLFKKIHEAVLYKYSVIDFQWEVTDGKQVVVGFKHFDQKYFAYDDDEVLKIDFGKSLADIPEEALVCETSETPAMLPILRDYILKNFGLESWAAFMETFGEGLIIGKYPPGADGKTIEALDAALDAIARSSRGSMPDTTNIEIIESKSGTGDHDKFEERCNAAISIALLGHANAVQDSNGMHIGENLAPFKVRGEIAQDDMHYIQPCMNSVIRTVYTRNFADDRIPSFMIDMSDPVNVGERIEVIDSAYNNGLTIDPNEYRKLGLTIADDQEPLVKTDPFNI